MTETIFWRVALFAKSCGTAQARTLAGLAIILAAFGLVAGDARAVDPIATTTVMSASSNPSVYGETVTFTATVTSESGAPTGNVTFRNGGTIVAISGLSDGGTASFDASSLAVGGHLITANYDGDGTYAISSSSDVFPTHTVDKGATTTGLSSSSSTSVYGEAVTLTATIAVTAPAAGTLSGMVTFKRGAVTLGTAQVLGGTATLDTPAIPVGAHTFTATYDGDGSFSTSTSAGVAHTVSKSATTTAIASSTNPAVYSQSVTLDATVAATAPGSGTPTGRVFFKDGANSLGVAILSGGFASITLSDLSAGDHTITVEYEGTGLFEASTSSGLTQTIDPGATSTLLGVPVAGSFGETLAFTAGVSASFPALGTPQGLVTFKADGVAFGSDALSDGLASISTKALEAGKHTITAEYAGGGGFSASSSTGQKVTIKKGATAASITKAPDEALPGEKVSIAVKIDGLSPAVGKPTGKARILDGGKKIGTVNLSRGKATFKTTALKTGTHQITVDYAGTTNWTGSTSAAVEIVVDPRIGDEFQINTFTADAQAYPSAAVLGNGGLVVAWQSKGQDGSGLGIFAQRYSNKGRPAGKEFQVNTETAGDQSMPVVAALASGGFVAAWESAGEDGSGRGIYAQRYNAKGKRSGKAFLVNTQTANHQEAPAVAALDDGGFIVGWASKGQDGSGYGVYAQRYNAKGKADGAEFPVNTETAGDQSAPALAALKDGGILAAWDSARQDGDGDGVYAQRFAANGKTKGKEFKVNTETADDQSAPALAALKDGGYLAAWTSKGQDGSGTGIYAQRYSAKGKRKGKEFAVNSETDNQQLQPVVAAVPDGGFLALWTSKGEDGSAYGVFGRRFNAKSKPVDTAFQVNVTTAKKQWQPAVTMFENGDYLAVWNSQNQDGAKDGIFGQLLGFGDAAADQAKDGSVVRQASNRD